MAIERKHITQAQLAELKEVATRYARNLTDVENEQVQDPTSADWLERRATAKRLADQAADVVKFTERRFMDQKARLGIRRQVEHENKQFVADSTAALKASADQANTALLDLEAVLVRVVSSVAAYNRVLESVRARLQELELPATDDLLPPDESHPTGTTYRGAVLDTTTFTPLDVTAVIARSIRHVTVPTLGPHNPLSSRTFLKGVVELDQTFGPLPELDLPNELRFKRPAGADRAPVDFREPEKRKSIL